MITRFIGLSIVVHGIAIAALYEPRPSWSWPAPEIRIHLVPEARDVPPRDRSRAANAPADAAIRAAAAPAPADPATSNAAVAGRHIADETPSETEARRVNHLRSAIYAEVQHHFVYPALARRHGWEGRVEVELRLDSEGRFRNLRLKRSSGYPILDSNAIETLQRIGALPRTSAAAVGYSQELPLLIVYQLLDG